MFKVESFACALFGAKTKISHPKTRFFAVVHNHKNQAAPLSTQEAHLPHAIGSELGIVLQLILALLAALVGGAVAFRLRQPVILGYLLGGIVFGPYVLRVVQDIEGVRAVAELGVALLMFALGIHLSFRELRQVQRVAVIGGAIQVLLTIGLGLAVGAAFDWDPAQAAFFGALMALSSTMVVLKVLQERGELDSLYGRITVGLLVIQDLSVVPLMVIMPTLGGRGGDTLAELGIAVAKAALVLGATVILGTRLVPAVLFRVAATHSRELFLLTVVSMGLGAAIATFFLGLSLAFGAFIGGMLISESEFRHQTLAEVLPLRDVFATVFFVSIGMLLDPRFVVDNWAAIAVVIAALLVGKFAICSVVPLLFRYPAKVALFTGLALVQMGEFSFVLARVGVETATLSEYHYSLALTAAIATMVLTPWLMQIGPPLYAFVAGLPLLGALVKELEPAPTEDISALSNHVVICGYGDVGRTLAQVLEGRGLKYLAIDYDPHAIMDLRRRGIPAIYGDAANRNVLSHANLPKARVLAVTLAEPAAGELAVQNARAINPRLDIIARAANLPAQGALRSAGAVEVVEPRFEAAAEIVRHTLHRYGLTTAEIQLLINHLREARYQGKEGEGT